MEPKNSSSATENLRSILHSSRMDCRLVGWFMHLRVIYFTVRKWTLLATGRNKFQVQSSKFQATQKQKGARRQVLAASRPKATARRTQFQIQSFKFQVTQKQLRASS